MGLLEVVHNLIKDIVVWFNRESVDFCGEIIIVSIPINGNAKAQQKKKVQYNKSIHMLVYLNTVFSQIIILHKKLHYDKQFESSQSNIKIRAASLEVQN